MDNFSAQMRVLQEILLKKKNLLVQIHTITENQSMVLLAKDTEKGMFEMFNFMNEEKQTLITQVIHLDNTFQGMFKGFKSEFEAKALSYPEESKMLKTSVKDVMDYDVKIRLLEEKNKVLLSTAPAYNVDNTNWFADDNLNAQMQAKPAEPNYVENIFSAGANSSPDMTLGEQLKKMHTETSTPAPKGNFGNLKPRNYIFEQYAKNADKKMQ